MVELQRRSRHYSGDLAEHVRLANPVAAHRLAVDIVPFGPSIRKPANLITAETDIPRFGDQFDPGQNRVLPDGREERRLPIEFRQAAQRGGEIEAETVNVIDLDPAA